MHMSHELSCALICELLRCSRAAALFVCASLGLCAAYMHPTSGLQPMAHEPLYVNSGVAEGLICCIHASSKSAAVPCTSVLQPCCSLVHVSAAICERFCWLPSLAGPSLVGPSRLGILLLANMPMTAGDIIAQIQGCAAFFGSQQQLLSDAMRSEGLAAMGRSISAQIASISGMELTEAASVNDAIASSPFPPEVKGQLAAAVAKGCLEQATAVGAAKRRQPQLLKTPGAYLTASDWAILEGGGPLSQKVGRVVERLSLVGMHNPSELSVKHAAALLAAAHWETATPQQLHGLVLDIKAAFASTRRCPASSLHLLTFPDDPAGLPDALRQAAFSSEGPVRKDLPGTTAWLGRIPLRSTCKSLQQAGGVARPARLTEGSLASAMQAMIAFYGGEHSAPPGGSAPMPAPALRWPSGWQQTPPSPSPTPLTWSPLQPVALPTPSPPPASSPLQQASLVEVSCADPPPLPAALEAPCAAPPTDEMEWDDEVAAMEAMAAGKTRPNAAADKRRVRVIGKRPPQSTGEADGTCRPTPVLRGKRVPAATPKAKAGPQRRASEGMPQKAPGTKVMLGCSKCRGSPKGCCQCRNPSYGGRRWQRE